VKLRQVALLAVALLAPRALAFQSPASQPRTANCVTCHGAEALQARASVHTRAAIDCITCHGGNPGEVEVARAHGTALRSLKNPREAVDTCGTCHSDVDRLRNFGLRTDQLSLYWTSQHGAQLALKEDANVATCVSCHGSHGVLAPSDPLSPVHPQRQVETCGRCHGDEKLMAQYGLPATQPEAYRTSVHGQALLEDAHPAAPSCTDCHGSHGALPPRVGEVEQVCGQCHSVVQDYYDKSPHAKSAGATGSVQCTACHSNHGVQKPTLERFVGDAEGHCGACHTEPGDKALAVGRTLHDDVEKLGQTIHEAELAVDKAGERGLFLGIERGYLDDARGLLVRARTMTHSLDPAALDDVLNRGQGMVNKTLEDLATKNRIFRDRKIFTAIFFAVSLAFAIALAMHARELAGRRKRVGRAS
jgi:hypothetical protein